MFAEATQSCKDRASEWNGRAHLRTQELAGIDKAIEILTDPDAVETLKAAQQICLTGRFQAPAREGSQEHSLH